MRFKMKITTIPQNSFLEHKLYMVKSFLWIFTLEYFVCNHYSVTELTIREVITENYQCVNDKIRRLKNSHNYPKTVYEEINSDE